MASGSGERKLRPSGERRQNQATEDQRERNDSKASS
jgi:hypothetical protein